MLILTSGVRVPIVDFIDVKKHEKKHQEDRIIVVPSPDPNEPLPTPDDPYAPTPDEPDGPDDRDE